MPSHRTVSKSDILVLRRPKSRKHPFIYVRVTVERGSFSLLSQEKYCGFLKHPKVRVEHGLKVLWVGDMLDDDYSQVKNCFVVISPESSYILQANSHRVKIEWMQAISIAVSQSLKFRGSYRPSSWSNLEDLQKWLNVRQISYTFASHKRYKGAAYTGKWNMGMPHICGSMVWQNGDRYEGEVVYGKFQGSGTMLWLTDKHMRSYTGSWQDGRMEGYGEMTYVDHSVYTGWWHMGHRHGHGTQENRVSGSLYVGAWLNDKRDGYGVFNNGTKSERYLGMWRNNRYHGAGILVAKDKFYYSGLFSNGEKGNGGNCSLLGVVVQDDKWIPLLQHCTSMLEFMVSITHSSPEIPHETEPSTKTGEEERGGGEREEENPEREEACAVAVTGEAVNMEDIGASPEMDASCRLCHTRKKKMEECVVCRVEGFKSADHPFGILVNNIIKCFIQSYGGVGAHGNLLPHATGELSSVMTRVHRLVSRYCPSVISLSMDEGVLHSQRHSQLSLLLKKHPPRRHGNDRPIRHVSSTSDPSWLNQILMPSIFPTLFGLYREGFSEEDRRVTAVMERMTREGDERLCCKLGITSDLQLYQTSTCEVVEEWGFTKHFSTATAILKKISEYSTPLNKLLCVQETNGEITQVWKAMDPEGRESPISSGSAEGSGRPSLPIGLFSFVVARSQVRCLRSELQFIEDFAGPMLATAEYSRLHMQLKESFKQICELSDQV